MSGHVLSEFQKKETIKYICACLLFGTLTLSTRKAGLSSSLEMTFLRTMIGTYFLMTIFVCSTRRATLRDYAPAQLCYLVISGLCIGLTWTILSDAGKKLGVVTATLTNSLGPGLLLLLAPLLFKEAHITPSRVAGFIICTAGVFVLDWDLLMTTHGMSQLSSVLTSAVLSVVIVVCNRHLLDINGLENAMFQMMVAFAFIAWIFVRRHGLTFEIQGDSGWWVLLAGIVHTGLPVYLYLSSVDDLRADIIAFVGYLRPLTTLFCAVLFFNEPLTPQIVIGASMILGGVAVSNMFRRKKLKKNWTF